MSLIRHHARQIALPVIVLLSGGVAAEAQDAPPDVPVIVTRGEATLKRAPDRAWLTVVTETREVRPENARRRSAETMTSVQNALRDAGVPADAIRTTGYSLTPEMDWDDGRGRLRGYLVRNQIEVRVDDLDRLPAVIDAANSSGSTALSIVGPRFDIKDDQSIQNEALQQAVQAALARAKAMAAGAGGSVGPIVRIEEQGMVTPYPRPMMAARAGVAEAAYDTPITPGEIEIHAQVVLTVELR